MHMCAVRICVALAAASALAAFVVGCAGVSPASTTTDHGSVKFVVTVDPASGGVSARVLESTQKRDAQSDDPGVTGQVWARWSGTGWSGHNTASWLDDTVVADFHVKNNDVKIDGHDATLTHVKWLSYTPPSYDPDFPLDLPTSQWYRVSPAGLDQTEFGLGDISYGQESEQFTMKFARTPGAKNKDISFSFDLDVHFDVSG